MKYTLGSLKNPKDLRDIQLAQVQAPVALPEKYITDISSIPVMNQKAIGACVGHAHAVALIYNEMKENAKFKMLSPRYLYALSKKIDGYAGQGTFPRVTASIMFKQGCASEIAIPNNTDLSHEDYIKIPENEEITADAKPYRIRGYAEVASDLQSLKQAIFQNGVIAITINVGNFENPIKYNPAQSFGLHRVLAYGFEGSRIFYRNSWGEQWGDKGNGYFDWGTQQVTDVLAFVDLPNEVIEKAKAGYRYFSEKEAKNMTEEFMVFADELRERIGFPLADSTPNSSFRTPEQNRLAGGVDNSAHLYGKAKDWRILSGEQKYKFIEEAQKLSKERNKKIGIGVGNTFCHLDVGHRCKSVVWNYK